MKNSLREYMKIALAGNDEELAARVDDEEGWRSHSICDDSRNLHLRPAGRSSYTATRVGVPTGSLQLFFIYGASRSSCLPKACSSSFMKRKAGALHEDSPGGS